MSALKQKLRKALFVHQIAHRKSSQKKNRPETLYDVSKNIFSKASSFPCAVAYDQSAAQKKPNNPDVPLTRFVDVCATLPSNATDEKGIWDKVALTEQRCATTHARVVETLYNRHLDHVLYFYEDVYHMRPERRGPRKEPDFAYWGQPALSGERLDTLWSAMQLAELERHNSEQLPLHREIVRPPRASDTPDDVRQTQEKITLQRLSSIRHVRTKTKTRKR